MADNNEIVELELTPKLKQMAGVERTLDPHRQTIQQLTTADHRGVLYPEI